MFFEKEELSKLFNKKIIQDFIDIVSKEPLCISLFYGDLDKKTKNSKTNLHNLLWSFIYNVQKTIDDIEKMDGVYTEADLLFLFNCINRLNEGIKVIKKDFEWINFEYENESLFSDNLIIFWRNIIETHSGKWDIEMNKFFNNDDLNFEYYRALLFHPFSTNRHPKRPPNIKNDYFKDYRYTQNALDFYIEDNLQERFNKDNLAEDNKYPIMIRIQFIGSKELDPNKHTIVNRDNNNSYFLNLNLDDITKYFKKKYESIISATKSLENKNNNLIENEDFKLNWSDDNCKLLDQIIDVLKKENLHSNDFQCLLDQYKLFLNNSLVYDNKKLLKDYFDDVFKTIRTNIKYLENSIYHKEYELFDFVYRLSYSEDIYNKYRYSIEKIFSYLFGERNGIIPNNDLFYSNDKQCGVNEALDFYNNFANKYVLMDVFNEKLTFLEIKLLFQASIWKYNKEKYSRHML